MRAKYTYSRPEVVNGHRVPYSSENNEAEVVNNNGVTLAVSQDLYSKTKPVGDSGSGYAGIEMPDYSKYYEQLAELSEQANQIAQREVAVGEQMLSISQEQYDWWKTNYQPYEEELIGQAKRGIDLPYAADVAGNRVGLAYAAQQGASGRFLERLGTDTSAERLARIRDDITLEKAAAEVNARNRARTTVATANRGMKTAIAALGNGAVAESLDAFGESAKSLSNSGAATNTGAATLANALQVANRGAGDAAENYYKHQTDQAGVNAQRQFMGEVAQSNYNSWLFGTIGNTVGTLAGAGLAASAYGGGQPLDQQTANTMLAPAYRGNRSPRPVLP